MTTAEARRIAADFERISKPTEDEEFLFIETMRFLIEEEQDPRDMMYLGGYYYEQRHFELALKYYELAASMGYDEADSCLGYIWYYGRTGERDYKKAFECFSRSMLRGNPISTYKVADMYKNGYYVERDYERYKSMIEALYPKIRRARYLNEPLPEIYTRLARIRKEEGRTKEAVALYEEARLFLAERIRHNPFFGNLSIMRGLIEDLSELKSPDPEYLELYDLYYLLKTPHRIGFTYRRRSYVVESLEEDGAVVIRFGDRWFRNRDEFFENATVGGKLLTGLYEDLDEMRVL